MNLNDPDFTTATRLVQAVNRGIGEDIATIVDGGSVRVRAPLDITQRVASSRPSRISRSIRGRRGEGHHQLAHRHGGDQRHVRVSPAAVSHGSLTVNIKEEQKVSQPSASASVGTTTVTTSSTINVDQGSNRMFLFKPGVELEQIVHAVNEVGAAPGDLVAILEALKEAGALQAELIVI